MNKFALAFENFVILSGVFDENHPHAHGMARMMWENILVMQAECELPTFTQKMRSDWSDSLEWFNDNFKWDTFKDAWVWVGE